MTPSQLFVYAVILLIIAFLIYKSFGGDDDDGYGRH